MGILHIIISFPPYSLSNFSIRHDVTCGRLRISSELPLDALVVYRQPNKIMVYGLSHFLQETGFDL